MLTESTAGLPARQAYRVLFRLDNSNKKRNGGLSTGRQALRRKEDLVGGLAGIKGLRAKGDRPISNDWVLDGNWQTVQPSE